MLENLKMEMNVLSSRQKSKSSSRFFKTKKGEYGEGDVFIGLNVPEQRRLAKKYADIKMDDIRKLLSSNIHEYKLTALLILLERYNKNDTKRKTIYDFYMRNLRYVNNWDLVDTTAPRILGNYLLKKDKSILYDLANGGLWERRVAIVSTHEFIRNGQYKDTLKICKILLDDSHDLIQKACGWMLREVGKKDQKTLEGFLDKNSFSMPRTMLRYAIERLPDGKKRSYMKTKLNNLNSSYKNT